MKMMKGLEGKTKEKLKSLGSVHRRGDQEEPSWWSEASS